MRTWGAKLVILLALTLVAVLLRINDANPAMAQTQQIGAWAAEAEPGMDGFAPEWQSIVPVFLPMTSQQVTPPMGGGSIERVAVRAVHWEQSLYVMLEWTDRTPDSLSDRYEDFTDAAAIQFPAEAGSEVPAICMGQADQAVNIWQWRADQQNPRPDLPEDAYVDMYQFTDDLHYTAREAGNPLAQGERTGVHNLLAGGFGTLEATDSGGLEGRGSHQEGRWTVVFTRPLQSGGDLQPDLDGGSPIDLAVAVWDGAQEERNGIKSVSAFTRLSVTPESPPRRAVPGLDDWPAYAPFDPLVLVASGLGLLVVIALTAVWFFWYRDQKGSDG